MKPIHVVVNLAQNGFLDATLVAVVVDEAYGTMGLVVDAKGYFTTQSLGQLRTAEAHYNERAERRHNAAAGLDYSVTTIKMMTEPE